MYGSELYQHDVRQLRTIQQRHLRLILNIKWDHFVSNEEVLKRAGVEDIETMFQKPSTLARTYLPDGRH